MRRVFTFLSLFIIGVGIGVIIDRNVINREYKATQKAAEVYYDMVLTLNGIGTYTIRNPFVIRTLDSLPLVIGLIKPSTCFNCIKNQLIILERFAKAGKISAVFFFSSYSDSREQIEIISKFKDYKWLNVNPVPDSVFSGIFGNVGNFGAFYYPIYIIGGGKSQNISFFASIEDTVLFKGWLEQALK